MRLVIVVAATMVLGCTSQQFKDAPEAKCQNINQLGRDGLAPLHRAVISGDNLDVTTLLSQGADPRIVDRHGNDGRALAIQYGRAEVLDQLDLCGALIVIDAAENVTFAMDPYGGHSVSYRVHKHVAPSLVISEISSQLESLGWKPLMRDPLNPNITTSHVRGWTTFVDSTEAVPQLVHQWLGYWRNGRGSEVTFALRHGSAIIDVIENTNDKTVLTDLLIMATVCSHSRSVEVQKETHRLRSGQSRN